MRRLFTGAALALTALLSSGCSGCSVLQKITSNDHAVLGQTLVDEKALYAAEAAMYGADTAAGAAVDSGLLKPGSPDAIKVANWLEEAHKALLVARTAYHAGDAKTTLDRLSAAQAFIGQAWALIPQKAS